MKTTGCYYMILSVYISLWICQAITCHLTHSLIVLTDSYINLYKILDISLGILHLHTQCKVRDRLNRKKQGKQDDAESTLKLFDSECTYNFKRLPILGSFINGLFLAALLLSAAIEGIQTCFHANHSGASDSQSILLEHPITYPGILVGFAVVGLMMQWCSIKAHEMREEELGSESLLDVRFTNRQKKNINSISELNVEQLNINSQSNEVLQEIFLAPPEVGHLNEEEPKNDCLSLPSKSDANKFVLNSRSRPKSCDSLPSNESDDQFTRISLRSLKLTPNDIFESGTQNQTVNSISKDLEAEGSQKKAPLSDKWWLLVRYCVSPAALVACAIIIYSIQEEMVTEIADATFAILVVTLLFTASYPPMKKAGKVLLQTAPDTVDLDKLKRSIKSISPIVMDVSELKVWSLTARSNRIATCHLYLNKDKIQSEKQVADLLREVKFKFLNQNIGCSTIQPFFETESVVK